MPTLTLDQYTRVTQALNVLGLPEAEVLAAEQISPEQWQTLRVGIEEEIGAALEEEGHPLLDRVSDAAERARRFLARPLPPLDQDPRAWFAFVRALNAASDPDALLARLSLHPFDILNLNNTWSGRLTGLMKEDPSVFMAEAAIPELEVRPRSYPLPPDPIGPVSDTVVGAPGGSEEEDDDEEAVFDQDFEEFEALDFDESPPVFAPLPVSGELEHEE